MARSRTDAARWDLSGLTDPASGELGRPLALVPLDVPPWIELDDTGEGLVWSRGVGTQFHLRAPNRRMLLAFTKLVDAPAEAIRDYARRYGVLRLCEHWLPCTHNWEVFTADKELLDERLREGEDWINPQWERLTQELPKCEPMVRGEHWWEPLAAWRRYASEARMMLTIAAHMRLNEPISKDEWRQLGESDSSFKVMEMLDPVGYDNPGLQRVVIMHYVRKWLRASATHLQFSWSQEGPRIEVHPHGLVGTLALQLATSLVGGDGFAFCSGCGRVYAPEETPRAGQRHYCEDCRERKVPQRDAARDYRQRERDGTRGPRKRRQTRASGL